MKKKHLHRWAAMGLLALGFQACTAATPPGNARAQSDDVRQLESALNSYSELVLKMDHAAIAGLFTEDGELTNPGQSVMKGRDAIRSFLEGFAQYQVQSNTIHADTTVVSGDTAVQQGSYAQRVRLPDKKVVDVSGRFKAEWARTTGKGWLIRSMSTTPAP